MTPSNNRCFGRNRPVAHGPRLRLSKYLTGALPPPPVSVDYSAKASAALSRMYKNDSLGDCVPACIAHLVGLFTGNANGTPFVFTDDQVVALYSAIGGYVPGDDSTDNGCSEQDALNYFQQHGAPAGSHQITGWLAVNPLDQNEVKTAQWLFENLFFGIELPDAWTNVQSSGFTWDAGTPNPQNGHCVGGVGFNTRGIQVSTWGMIGTLTWAALARDVIAASGGELYTVLSPDVISRATSRAPTGFNWQQLVADFDAIGGHLPVPSPAPPIPPPPVPPIPAQGPTKAQTLAAVNAAISALPWTR